MASLVGLVMLMTAMKPNHVNNYFDDGDARFISEMQLFPLEPRKCLKAGPAVTLESLSTNWMSEFHLLMLMCLDTSQQIMLTLTRQKARAGGTKKPWQD